MLVWIILEITHKVADRQDVDTDIYWEAMKLYNTRYIETVDSVAWRLMMQERANDPW